MGTRVSMSANLSDRFAGKGQFVLQFATERDIKVKNKPWVTEKNKLTHKIPANRRPFDCLLTRVFAKAVQKIQSGGIGKPSSYDSDSDPDINYALIGGYMETSNIMLEEVNKEAEESKKILQKLCNDMKAMSDIVHPELLKMIRDVRTSRMEITTELQKALTAMRDVRKFFLESEYTEEMNRLEKFISLAERMKALIQDGTMDAICDVVLKFAVGD